MKYNYIFGLMTLALVASCQNEELLSDDVSPKEEEMVQIVATASVPEDAQTRLLFTEEGTGSSLQLKPTWNEYDQFAITDGDSFYEVFSLTSGDGSNTASFTGSIPASVAVGKTLYAIYPADLLTPVEYKNPTIDLSMLMYSKGNATVVMWQKADLTAERTISFDFKYITTVLRVYLPSLATTNPIAPYWTENTYDKSTCFDFSASAGLYGAATLDMKTGNLTGSSAGHMGTYSIYFMDNGNKLEPANEIYLNIFPGTYQYLKLSFNLVDCMYESDVTSNFTFTAGNFYYTPELTLKKTGFVLDRFESGITFKTLLDRIVERDTQLDDASRKTLIIGGRQFATSEYAQTSDYGSGLATTSSVIGNWLRTKATKVEVLDLSRIWVVNSSGKYELPDYAFYGCSNLKTVYLPDDLYIIGEYAFGGLTGVSALVFGPWTEQLKKNSVSGLQKLVLMHAETAGEKYYDSTKLLSEVALRTGSETDACCLGNTADIANAHVFLPYCFTETTAKAIQEKLTITVDTKKYAPAIHYYGTWGTQASDTNLSNYKMLMQSPDVASTESNYSAKVEAINGVSVE